MRGRFYTFSCFLLLIVIVTTMTGCQGGTAGQPETAATPTPIPPPPVPELPTYVVSSGTVIKSVELSGRVSPVLEEELGFEVGGRVKAVYVERGDVIEAGTLLGELENDDILSHLAQVEIDLENAQNRLQSSIDAKQYDIQRTEVNLSISQLQLAKMLDSTIEQDIAIQKANLQKAEAALKQAQTNYDQRASQPGYEGSPQALALEQATLSYEIAQANYAKTLASARQHELDIQIKEQQISLIELELEQLKQEIDPQLVNAVDRSQLSVDQVQAQLDQTRVYATIDGIVTASAPSEGGTVSAYKTQFIVADMSELEITVDPTSTDISEMWEEMPVSIEFSSQPGQAFEGTVRQMPYPYGTSGASDLRESDPLIHITMDMDETDVKSGAGCVVTAVIEVHDNALWLPPIALREFSGRYFVLVDDNGVERRIDVEVGIESLDRVEILSGLEEGQIVLGQ